MPRFHGERRNFATLIAFLSTGRSWINGRGACAEVKPIWKRFQLMSSLVRMRTIWLAGPVHASSLTSGSIWLSPGRYGAPIDEAMGTSSALPSAPAANARLAAEISAA